MPRLLLALAILAISMPAHADKDKKHKDKDKGEKTETKDMKDKGKLSFSGRVFARAALTQLEGGDWTAQASVPSARVSADYKWERLKAEVEFELTSANLKDAYLQLRTVDTDAQKLDVQLGQFKMPFSEIQLTSGWKLPVADRGLLDTVFTKRLQIAGRHPGAMVEWKQEGGVKAHAYVGVFQGWNDAGDPLEASPSEGFGQDVVGRATIEPADGIQLGAAVESRAELPNVTPASIDHRWAADVDVTIDRDALRVWLEGLGGSSWIVSGNRGARTGATFVGGRAIAAYRFGGHDTGDCFVEPYVLVGALNPDTDRRGDLVLETSGGVAYGQWDRWRIQAEAERWSFGDNAPFNIEDPIISIDQTSFLLQAGAHF